MCHFALHAPILRRTFPRPFYPQERTKLQMPASQSFSGESLCGAFMALSHCCTSERVVVQSPFGGASKLPPKPPWPRENFISTLWNPIDQRCISWLLWIPSIISLRPTVRRLDAVNISMFNYDHCFASGKRPRIILGCGIFLI